MTQLGIIAALAAMTGIVAAGFVWFGGALVTNLLAMRASRRAEETVEDEADA